MGRDNDCSILAVPVMMEALSQKMIAGIDIMTTVEGRELDVLIQHINDNGLFTSG